MSDVTYSVKIDEDLKVKITSLIKDSGMTGKEFFNRLLSLYESEKVDVDAKQYSRELEELEGHLSRIRVLYVNLVEKFRLDMQNSNGDWQKVLEERVKLEGDLKTKTDSLATELKETKGALKERTDENADLRKRIKTVIENAQTNAELIKEYKDRIESLKLSVESLRENAKENEILKKAVEDLKGKSALLAVEKETLSARAESLEKEIQRAQKEREDEIERLKIKSDLEKQKAVMDEREESQRKMEKLVEAQSKKNEEYNTAIKGLYEQIDGMREKISKFREKPSK